MTALNQGRRCFVGILRQQNRGGIGNMRSLAPMPKRVDHGDHHTIFKRLYHVTIAALRFAGTNQCRHAPIERVMFQRRFHLVTVIVVPRPSSDTSSNSSMMRRTPGRPRPKPPEVEYPSCIASRVSAIPGPASRAMIAIPWRSPLLTRLRKISPSPAYMTMLSACSEIVVATSVASLDEKPSCSAITL